MERFDIINHLIKINGYQSFLEIGTQRKINFENVKIDFKLSVDPDPQTNADMIMESDKFFEFNNNTFDIIFVDGLHHSDYAYRDIINSLKILNEGGCVIVHDVIPESFNAQIIPMEKAYDMGTIAWNGDVWKAWIKIRTEYKNLIMDVVDTDHGCGIISLTQNGKGNYIESYNEGYYVYDEMKIRDNLSIINEHQFMEKYSKPFSKNYYFF